MTIFVDLPFNSFCRTEKSVEPFAAGTTTSVDDSGAASDVPSVVGDLAEAVRPVVAA